MIRRSIDIPVTTKIGYGFYPGHALCIVINGHTVIGNNVTISQFVNIGSSKRVPAVICDGVYIGPQVCVIEDVVIGHNSQVGAGAIVTKDVAPATTVAGVPARVISNNRALEWHYYKNVSRQEQQQ